jgi:hypothetical protein
MMKNKQCNKRGRKHGSTCASHEIKKIKANCKCSKPIRRCQMRAKLIGEVGGVFHD